MFHIFEALFCCPFCAFLARALGEICAFGEDEEPHWIGGVVELVEVLLEGCFVLLPLALEEDEVVELGAPAYDGDVLEGFLEDDVDVAVHVVGVGYPPQVQPVCV